MTAPACITAAEMRKIEHDAIESGQVTGLELMERAGHAVVSAIQSDWPAERDRWRAQKGQDLSCPTGNVDTRSKRHALVLCGPGNNGGDGFVIARLLHADGWQVAVQFFGKPEHLPPDAKTNYTRWLERGSVAPMTYDGVAAGSDAELIVDAIFGIGLCRPVTGELGRILKFLATSDGQGKPFREKLVAVDVPSGLEADLGELPGHANEKGPPACPFCALTVTFHRAKYGHLRGHGPAHCGKVVVKDIGL